MDGPHLFTCSFIRGHLGCSHLWAVVNNAAVDIGVQMSVQTPAFSSSGCILRSGIAEFCVSFWIEPEVLTTADIILASALSVCPRAN